MSDEISVPVKRQGGAKVVSIGELRIARGWTRREKSDCKHLDLTYDSSERRVWCDACETEIDPFDALMAFGGHFGEEQEKLRRREREVAEAEAHSLHRRAAKALDEAWRSRNMVPCCKACGAGLVPDDYADSRYRSMVSYEYAEAQRRKRIKDATKGSAR